MSTENINVLQNKFHLLIEQYLNGYTFSKLTKVVFPLSKSIQLDKSKDLINLINEIIDSNFEPKTNKEMAQYICNVYSILQKNAHNESLMEKRVEARYTFNSNNYNEPQKTSLENLTNYMKKKNIDNYIDLFLIHGSYSTLDYESNISDLDTLILLKEDIFKDYKKLIDLQSILYNALDYFYEIDILQHHGFFILTQFDTQYFNETFFPTMLFDYSTKILGEKDNISFFIRNNNLERKNIFIQTLNYLDSNNPEQFDRLIVYKVYFQVLQLVPISYLQYKNIQSYKKYSFDIFFKDFPQYEDFFTEIYKIRLSWKQNSVKALQDKNLIFKIFPIRLLFLINSKMEKVDTKLKKEFGNDAYINKIKPLVNDLRKVLNDTKL